MTQNNRIRPIPIAAIAVLNSRERSQKPFKELVTSITNLGLKRPITVSDGSGSGAYELVCGEGRIEAFRALGQTDIPAIIVNASTQDCLLMGLVENIARRRHSPLELISDIGRLAKIYRTADIAAKLDLKPEHVRAVCFLLRHGEQRLLSALERGLIPPTLAIEIAKAKTPKLQGALLETHVNEKHTSKQIATMRKLVEQRYRDAEQVRQNRGEINSTALVRAYRRETDRQKRLAQKAALAQARLLFIVNALKTLLSERMFVTLLRQASLDQIPPAILRRIASLTEGKA